MSLREAAQQALVCVVCVRDMAVHPDERMRDMAVHPDSVQMFENTITALRTALAEPEQEPVAWAVHYNGPIPLFTKTKPEAQAWGGNHISPLYTHPPQRKPLTDEEICHVVRYEAVGTSNLDIARAIERAHGIGGEA